MQRLLTAAFVQSMTGGNQQTTYTMRILLLLHDFSTIITALHYKWHILRRIYFHTHTHTYKERNKQNEQTNIGKQTTSSSGRDLSATNNKLFSVPTISVKLCYISSFSLQLNSVIMVYHTDITQNVTPLTSISKVFLFKALQIIRTNSQDRNVKKIISKDCDEINHYILLKNQPLLTLWHQTTHMMHCRAQGLILEHHSKRIVQ